MMQKLGINDEFFFVPDGSKVVIDYGKKTFEVVCPTESSSSTGEEGRTSRGTSESENTIINTKERDSSEGCQRGKCQTQGERVINHFPIKYFPLRENEPQTRTFMRINGSHGSVTAKAIDFVLLDPIRQCVTDPIQRLYILKDNP